MIKRIVRFSLVIFSIGIFSSLYGAETGGEISGQIKNSSGEIVVNASIRLKHSTKGTTRTVLSNENGDYTLRNLPVGKYKLTITADGYASITSDVSLKVGEALVVENTLVEESSDNKVVIVGTVVKGLNMAETTAGSSFDDYELDFMPVDNGFESMALMTPGVVENGAPASFNGASAIGGASSAENAYYLNGINITQIQSGLGSFRMPWEAIQQTNVQTGGITAEFGGALGGIINSVSKSGSNDMQYGVEYKIFPEAGYSHHDSVRLRNNANQFSINNLRDEESFSEYNVWASGPIVRDKAFFYVLFNPQTEKSEGAGNSNFAKTKRTSERWFANFEWFISDDHSVGITSFNTERDLTAVTYPYDATNNDVLPIPSGQDGRSYQRDGGTFFGINYHGQLTNNLSLDIVMGKTEEEEVPRPASSLVSVQDCSSGSCVTFSNHSDDRIEPQKFTRDQFRMDFHWDLETHKLAFGIDNYDIDVYVNNRQNGVVVGDIDNVDDSSSLGWWHYGISGQDSSVVGSIGTRAFDDGVPDGQEFVRRRVRNRFSDSTVSSSALYLQDSWSVTDRLTLNLGVRMVDFENTVSSGETYADLKNNIAPRLAAIWDLSDESESKFFASFGRYFQPVAARMNITQGSSSIEYFDYYENVGAGQPTLLSDGSPERGNSIVPRYYTQTGITDPNLIASKNLKAMYSEQISFGYSRVIEDYEAGVRFTFNELKRSVEDTDYGPVLLAKLAELGIANNTGQSNFYILSNPGEEVQIAYDFDGNGSIENITLTPEDVQLPKPERKYLALDFTLSGALTSDIGFNASYTWSHSFGNTEGLVKTTNGQADPGWTSDYDYGESLDYAKGNLPNDRRHSIKFAGIYDLSDTMSLGLVYRGASGRPKNKLSPHPLGVDGCAPSSPWSACESRSYVGSFYDENGNPVPRGTAGNLPWTHVFDMSFSYKNEDVFNGLLLKATVFNLLNGDAATDVDEWVGENYGITQGYQRARRISLLARLDF